MKKSAVIFKGSVNGMTIILKEEETFENILKLIEAKVLSAPKFFKGSILKVKYKGKKLSLEQEKKIFEILQTQSGAKIDEIQEEVEESNENSLVDLARNSFKKHTFFTGIEEGVTKVYKGTVRSGKLLKFAGNIVVIGDVNPGGEIIANGNIMIMGGLRGMVHAGADGNKEALVVALNLQPTQLRIADVITRSPELNSPKNKEFVPEFAYVKDDMVYIERYLPQR